MGDMFRVRIITTKLFQYQVRWQQKNETKCVFCILKFFGLYIDVTWVLWRNKSLVTGLCVQQPVQMNNRENIKISHNWSSVRRIDLWLVDSPQQEPIDASLGENIRCPCTAFSFIGFISRSVTQWYQRQFQTSATYPTRATNQVLSRHKPPYSRISLKKVRVEWWIFVHRNAGGKELYLS